MPGGPARWLAAVAAGGSRLTRWRRTPWLRDALLTLAVRLPPPG